MARAPLSVTIITLNEEKRIARAIQSVKWAEDILVVDCGSTDRTESIARAEGARFMTHAWQGYGQQKNFAQTQARYDWVLNIDADERLSPQLTAEIQRILESAAGAPHGVCSGYRVPRLTRHLGRWIRHGGWYPNYLVRLVRRDQASWTEPKVHESLIVRGDVGTLKGSLLHYPFEGVQDQIRANLRYSREGFEQRSARGDLPSIFKLIYKPIFKFIETYFIKRGFLDGVPGLIISINAAHSVFMRHSYFFEPKGDSDENPHH